MGGQSNPTVTQTNTTQLNPQQSAIYSAAFPYIQSFAQTPLKQWSGPTVAGFEPLQTQAQAGATGVSAPAGMALGQAGQNAISNILSPQTLNIAQNPTFQGAASSITDLANRNLTQNILPAVSGASTVAGGQYAGGGTREGLAQGKAIGDTAIATNSAIQQLANTMYGQGLAAQGTAAGQVPLMQAAQLFSPEVMSAVGGQQQNLTQQQINAAIGQFYGGQELPFLQSSDIMSLLASMPGATGVGTTTGAVPQPSLMSQALGGIAGAAGLNSIIPGGLFGSSGLGGLWSGISGGLGDLFTAGGLSGAAGAGSAGGGIMSSLASMLPFALI